jgi:hypothetical protein
MPDAPSATPTEGAPDTASTETTLTKDEALKLFREEANKIHSSYKKEIAKIHKQYQSAATPTEEAPADPNDLSALVRQQNKTIQDMQRREKERDAALRDKEARAGLSERLLAKGVAPKYAKHAVGFLTDVQKAVRYDDTGALLVRVGQVEYDNIDEAADAFIQSDDAKPYLAASDAKGSGATTHKGSRPATQPALTKDNFGDVFLDIARRGDV